MKFCARYTVFFYHWTKTGLRQYPGKRISWYSIFT